MIASCIFALAILSVIDPTTSAAEYPCSAAPADSGRTLELSVRGRRNETGDWMTSLSAVKDLANASDGISVDLKHRIIECGGKMFIQIEGIVRDTAFFDGETERLLFHQKTGTNAALSNGGRTVQKINAADAINSVVLTGRPLRPNEILEVILDKLSDKFPFSLGIGITKHSPNYLNIPGHMNQEKTGTWLLYDDNVWNNGSMILKGYVKSISQLPVGARVGVMRSDTGALHFYVNGADQGPAASNVPHPVYGVVELRGKALQASITGGS